MDVVVVVWWMAAVAYGAATVWALYVEFQWRGGSRPSSRVSRRTYRVAMGVWIGMGAVFTLVTVLLLHHWA